MLIIMAEWSYTLLVLRAFRLAIVLLRVTYTRSARIVYDEESFLPHYSTMYSIKSAIVFDHYNMIQFHSTRGS